MTQLAVFDWNCTLIDDVEACLEAKNAALAYLGHGPLDLATFQEIFTFPIKHTYQRAGVDIDYFLTHAEDVSKVFLHTYEEAAEACGMRYGANIALSWLQARGIPAVILSNHLIEPLQKRVEKLGLYSHFEAVLGTERYATLAYKMDKQERLEAYMAENGYKPQQSLIIGDTHEEAELARNLGMTGISITGGLFSRQRLEACQPDYIIDSLSEMIDICHRTWPQNAQAQ